MPHVGGEPVRRRPMEWYMEAFRRYAEFDGRSRRREYWTFHVMNFVIMCAIGLLTALLMPGLLNGRGNSGLTAGVLLPLGLLGLFFLATVIPGLAVTVRRLHDTNRSG